ncbi:pyridoxamine 5'-phosphate oxidase family protein [Kordiimonas sp.]|uniref:pyridoxamine 5'-phosphate oxidase family protein n=1 Tax=Kordiimonas sp. TaxID=1970157 RepID=UPI003A8D0463
MAYGFLDRLTGPGVIDAQEKHGSRRAYANPKPGREFDRFTENEAHFITARDSFYIASISETGWPYVQHRGGPPGFLKVLDPQTLAFADFSGNRQYITLGNTGANNRVALFLMDYAHRARLKVLARLEVRNLDDDENLAQHLMKPGYRAKAERIMVMKLETFDWNCPQHITPRFTANELEETLGPIRAEYAALEAENRALRAQLAEYAKAGNHNR